MRMTSVFYILILVAIMGTTAKAQEAGTTVSTPPQLVEPAPDPSVSLAIVCHNNTFNTMGAQSAMSSLLDRLQDFCKDQNKDVLPDPGQAKNPLQCIDYTVTELNKAERPGRACRQSGSSWNIVK